MLFKMIIPSFLIGFSYTFLLYNKIYFGISLVAGIIMLFYNFKFTKFDSSFLDKKIKITFFLTTFVFLLSTLNSILIQRSLPVIIYLIVFILASFYLLIFLKNNAPIFKNIIKFFTVSTVINILFIFFYNIYNTDFEHVIEIKRFKGVLNIITIGVILLPFFNNNKKNFLLYLPLLPTLYLSNSNSPILGIIFGLTLIILYYLKINFKIKRSFSFIFLITLLFSSFFLSKYLPSKFDKESINNQVFKIPTNLIDIHRQYIWGFSLKKIIEKPILGYGPDTSNFINDSQIIIGHESTGTMPFIPSHPHNFFIELLLDTGFIGALFFSFFILFLNLQIFKYANIKEKYYLIFFNGFFWGASLVNFSFWLGWWQGSYFFILSLIFTHIFIRKKLLD